MRLEVKKYLFDILRASDCIKQFVVGVDLDDYLASDLIQSAVERQLATIGEALNRLSKLDGATAARVTDRRRIIALRNVLIHAYSGIDARIVWSVVTNDLPLLRQEVEALLSATGGDG